MYLFLLEYVMKRTYFQILIYRGRGFTLFCKKAPAKNLPANFGYLIRKDLKSEG